MKKQHFAAALILMIFMLAIFPAHGETVSMNVSGVPNLTLSVDPTGKAEGFSAIVYNNPNGLPTSEANAIAETSEGFIWIGSYAGLIRYDGNTFERIDSTTGIASVRSLYVDSGDRLWIGTNDSGLFLMTKGELYHWDKAEGLKSSSVRTITEDAEGNICAGSTAGIAVIDKELKLSDLSDERIVSQTIRELRRGADGLVYGLTSAGDLFTLKDGKTLTVATSTLTFDKNGYLQSSRSESGEKIIYYWNKQGYLAKNSDGEKYTYYFSSNGQLKKSAYYRNGKKQSVSYYNKDGLLTKTVSSISKETITYEYKYNKNGLVSTIIKTTTNNGKKSVDNIKVSYSKTKTDKKTYTLFINGHDTCYDNPVL